ncbi:efflux RND transporter periplasmic adaptor subunit [Dawidia soli]|uniref:Efflux RND transporter periplasmic adaptor subunit n=1 Tax=Dawidia soli TaxID=2782352 RepID=A0AAP2D8T0_9BACT|nr:efflux RND transporter periplasmic adaptor subunit [Dawidia soli]MBT1686440.1 efflux RND transporter periplasmic adaptor subunit [Dawidia soli]
MKRLLIIITLAASLTACTKNQKPVDVTRQPQHKDSRYELGKVVEKGLAAHVRIPGQLKPFEEVTIFSKVNGFVKTLHVDRGDVVRQGDILITLEALELESQYQAASSKYIQAQENAAASKERYRRLREAARDSGAVAPIDLDNASSRMRADEATVLAEKSNMESMKNVKEYLTIRAPFSGVIVQRNISVGALVGPANDKPMVVLQYLDKLRLEVYIPEAYVDKVDLNRPVSFEFTAWPGKEHTATISRSANALSSLRSEAVEIDVNNKNKDLKPGMYAEVKIPLLSSAKSLLVPNNAIVRSTEKQFIIKVDEGKAKIITIREGLKTNDSTEVFGKLTGGDEIILHATDEIAEGTAVK